MELEIEKERELDRQRREQEQAEKDARIAEEEERLRKEIEEKRIRGFEYFGKLVLDNREKCVQQAFRLVHENAKQTEIFEQFSEKFRILILKRTFLARLKEATRLSKWK